MKAFLKINYSNNILNLAEDKECYEKFKGQVFKLTVENHGLPTISISLNKFELEYNNVIYPYDKKKTNMLKNPLRPLKLNDGGRIIGNIIFDISISSLINQYKSLDIRKYNINYVGKETVSEYKTLI